MKYDLNILNQYIADGLIVKQDHPTLPISIYNYSRTCQYEKKWDDITINMRGTILDQDGNVVAKAFPKFFNMEEMDVIPNEPFKVYEKMDGSLGIVFYYNGEWHLASKGSFTSEQAVKGREMLQKYLDNPSCDFHPAYTYLFEIIYNENRIVVKYDFEDVVLLARIPTHKEFVQESDVQGPGFQSSFRVVKLYDGINDYTQLKSMISNDAEGFVVRFMSSNIRMKIKGDEYVRLHKIVSNFSTTTIWEMLKDGQDLEPVLQQVPDEFDKWVRQQISSFKYGYYSISEYCGKIHDYFRYGKYNDVDPEPTKKEFALHLERNNTLPGHKAVCFAMWDGRSYGHIIWKLLKPKYAKPFKQDEDQV